MTTRRKFLILIGGLIALLFCGIFLLHSSAVQEPLIRSVADSIEASTGLQVGVDDPRFRLWPARFVSGKITVSIDGRQIAAVERVKARWWWSKILGSPRRIETLEVNGLDIDLSEPVHLPSVEPVESEPADDPWRIIEIGRLRLSDSRGAARVLDVFGEVDGLRAEADLVDGRASVSVAADRLSIERQNRNLDLGPVSLRAVGSSQGVIIEDLMVGGGEIEIRGNGEVALSENLSGSAEFTISADLARTLGWWDPNLVTGLEPDGVLDLDGSVEVTRGGELKLTGVHRGERVMIVGTAIDELEFGLAEGVPEIRLAGEPWGEAEVSVQSSGVAAVHARLREAPVERLLVFTAPEAAALVNGPVLLTGEIDGTVSYPFTLDTLAGEIDIEIDAADLRGAVKARGAADEWTVSEASVELPGASMTGAGELRSGGRIDAAVDLRIDDGKTAKALMAMWMPDLEVPRLGGGPLTAHAVISGSIADPRYEAEAEWASPVVEEYDFDSMQARVDGDLNTMTWAATLLTGKWGAAEADGTVDLGSFQVEGRWGFDIDNLHRVTEFVGGTDMEMGDVTGVLEGNGGFTLDESEWSIDGNVRGFDVGMGEWRSEEISAVFGLDASGLELSKLTLAALGGSIVGSGRAGLGGFDSEVSLNLEWRDLDLTRVPMDLPGMARGQTSGDLEIDGTVAYPKGRAELRWKSLDEDSDLPHLKVACALDDGVVTFLSEEVSTDAGSLLAQGELPVGVLPRPEWLWPEAPDHALRISARGHGLKSDAFAEIYGLDRPPVSATGDLDLEASWHPARPEETRVLAEVRDLRLRHLGGEIVADGPLVVRVSENRAELEPVILTGPETHIEMAGGAELATGQLDGSINAILAPGFARNIPYPVQIHEPISVSATMAGSLDRPQIGLDVNHPGGALVFRDPPLRIRDLVLSAELIDGVLWINDGRARVNQGTMEVGGGWDPVSRQGVVAEFDNVVVFVGGILSQWSGAVAIEPQPDRLARVVGELNLVAGLWDQNVSIGGAIFGSQSIEAASDDPLNEISLDLDVRGRGIVRVENNLGRFDARWDVLRVTGRAARPSMKGEIKIAPGGRFSLAGQRVTVRRGSLLFTGDPDIDPIVEIVPESDFAVFGTAEGQVQTSAMATQGLAEGIAGALGFENETLQPAEISVETEKETSQHFMLGQRISHNIALFFATNTTDVQDRTSMLQLWNLPGLKGLAVQGYEKTLTEEFGANVVQRFQWGGSSLYDDRPTIRKLKLNGEWPLSKRGLRRSTGFRRGQPFDPFLQFVARVRMERKLAVAGYQEARVRAESIESNNAWTMNFECDAGPRQEIVFSGDVPPRRVQEEVTALYRHPPLEAFGFRNMVSVLDRHFDVEGYPDASIVVERREDQVVAEISRQGLTELGGPFLEGVPESVSEAVIKRLGNRRELALLVGDEERAIGIIERVLGDQGYRKANVRSVETVVTSAERAEVRAVVDLGPRAVVTDLIISGSDPLGLTDVDDFSLKAGSPLDRLAVDLAASRIRAGYDAAGYSDAIVRGSAEEVPAGGWAVTIHIEPGVRRVLKEIEVTGLKHTSQRAIVSGVSIKEGEILRNSDLDATAARVANFSPIERVDVRTVPQGSTGAKVEIDVIEKKRWTTEVGGGWSSERGPQARFGLRDDALFGRGFSVNLRGRWDKVEWLGFVVASLPPLPGKKLSFSSTIGFSRGEPPNGDRDFLQDESFWSIETTRWLGGGEMATGHAGEQVTAYYRYTTTHTYNKVPPEFWWDEVDTTIDVGLIGARYVRDRFDYPFDPTKGYGLMFDAGYSDDLLGSDLDYWTALANGSVATGVFGSTTWMQSMRAGAAVPLDGTNLIEENKFFAGGQGSVRGFDRNSLGPVVFSGEVGFEPAGGGALFILNEELRIPVWGNFRAAVFADIGQVWESWGEADFNLSVGAGVGIRWATPVGPLWADIAWPVVNRGISSSKPKFYVGIGRPF